MNVLVVVVEEVVTVSTPTCSKGEKRDLCFSRMGRRRNFGSTLETTYKAPSSTTLCSTNQLPYFVPKSGGSMVYGRAQKKRCL